MSDKPIYIGITRNPPKIVSIGETIDGMKVVDILLDNDNIDEITSKLELEFDELSDIFESRTPIAEVSVVAEENPQTKSTEEPDPDTTVATSEEPVVEQEMSVVTSEEPVVEPDTSIIDVKEPVVEPEMSVVTSEEPVVEPKFSNSYIESEKNIPSSSDIVHYSGGNIKKHKRTKRYKHNQTKRRKTKRKHKQ